MDEKNELTNMSETDDRREIIKQKLRQYYDEIGRASCRERV